MRKSWGGLDDLLCADVQTSVAAIGDGPLCSRGFLFFGSFIGLTVLQIYYIDHRPHIPQYELERNVPLPWTRPVSYGTAVDASKMFVVFSTGFYSIALFAAGRAIRIYILDDDLPIR